MLTYVYIGSVGPFKNVYVNKKIVHFIDIFLYYVISANIKRGGFLFFISNVKGMYVLLRLNH